MGKSQSLDVFKYDGLGEQCPGPFAKYLEKCRIIPQYTMQGKPNMNGVAERRNRVLKDMEKPNIRHLHVWGCPTGARSYRPNERKLDPRTISCYFVRYSEHSRGFKFYDPTSNLFFETENAKFLENVEFERENNIKKVVFEEELVSLPNVAIDDVQTSIPDFIMEPIIE
ncbi:Retrovirus-related Pol polyprotein from transposon TNT 1-94 [Cucumis melo var. makuwa]|uniref:Retrovirus-related Pol polyprotein from transposon TNT 1-94 n=1 Tax=Cucumis melo var. makuwa TaxID=1194695 RepID=A0A5D3E121_CUCMM|nr:Retrovirus-related Pol polyprotein from transposon TNT 1-94 [Cucumis melo var. makuwa]TYK29155.1 Retrovirus-related Pol polyprotein from transposon TNT 1-94 [Cucumis melo var. makuwa]